jgi:hypothetical protein
MRSSVKGKPTWLKKKKGGSEEPPSVTLSLDAPAKHNQHNPIAGSKKKGGDFSPPKNIGHA